MCRYDLRRSSNNVEERRQRQPRPGTTAAERSLTPQQLEAAKATIGGYITACSAQSVFMVKQLPFEAMCQTLHTAQHPLVAKAAAAKGQWLHQRQAHTQTLPGTLFLINYSY